MKKYNSIYFAENKKQIMEKRRLNKEKNRQNWKKWWLKKKNQERKDKIRSGQIYKPKIISSS